MKRLVNRLPNQTPKIRLDDYLAEWLPQALGTTVSKSKIRTLIFSGSVYINRHRNKNASTDIYGGAVIEVYYDESKLATGTEPSVSGPSLFKAEHILFEDDFIVVVNKVAGIPTQPTIDPNRPNLNDLVKSFLAKRSGKSEVYLGLHHRLDRDTSGLVMFTKKEEANKGVADLFSQHQIQKTYQCIVANSSPEPMEVNQRFEVNNYLGRISDKNEKAMFGRVNSGGDVAHTYFRVLEKFKNAYWLEAQPKTGRTHQIRVHTSEMGLPILGDTIYFPKNVFSMIRAPRLMLHAAKLDFNHPMTGKPMSVTSHLPEDFFNVLTSLRA